MLTIEKVIILKSVSIFSKMPEETLIELATVAGEREFLAQELIFAQGDMGTSLYVIVNGQVKIHQGEQPLALLNQRQVFGELAALDPEPRSASATAVEETLLLEFDRDTLYELVAEYVEVARGIIEILCQRLRNAPKGAHSSPNSMVLATNQYESPELVNRYLLFHYGTRQQQSPSATSELEGFDFPARCVTECLNLSNLVKQERALDLGCAVGRSAFELSRHFPEVLAVDFSRAFIEAALLMQKQGSMRVPIPVEGAITQEVTFELPHIEHPERVQFLVGDALNPDRNWGLFDCILAANLLDRVPDPAKLLEILTELTASGGQLIIISPYSWQEDFTPKKDWPTGTSLEFLHHHLNPNFELVQQKEMPFYIREHARKFQWSSAQATTWIKKRKIRPEMPHNLIPSSLR